MTGQLVCPATQTTAWQTLEGIHQGVIYRLYRSQRHCIKKMSFGRNCHFGGDLKGLCTTDSALHGESHNYQKKVPDQCSHGTRSSQPPEHSINKLYISKDENSLYIDGLCSGYILRVCLETYYHVVSDQQELLDNYNVTEGAD